jgi:hypothetical protein
MRVLTTTLVKIPVGEIKNYEDKVKVRGKTDSLSQPHQIAESFFNFLLYYHPLPF